MTVLSARRQVILCSIKREMNLEITMEKTIVPSGAFKKRLERKKKLINVLKQLRIEMDVFLYEYTHKKEKIT